MAAVDPSQNVHGDLLPHAHLLSTFRYAIMPRVEIPDVTKWLLQAPKIARDTAPFFWTYLDCPQDGTIYLTWQPTSRRGLDFASDGYVWTGPEVYYRHDVGNGLILEIYYQRSGYRPGEQFTAHARRRFRLSPPQQPVPNIAQVDPNLWIVQYGPSDKNERINVNQIPNTPQIQQMMGFRHHLFQMGQIVRKEFMLSDRVNWPQIPLPGRGQSMYAAPMPPRNVPQTMAYPPHPAPPTGGPTPKRRGGHAQEAAAHQSQMIGRPPPSLEGAFDDDEDVSRGDLFDHFTPREVSMARYQQNHEWMEEILSSPYRLGQIEVADLGLGRKGQLASLTEGIFEAQGTDAIVDGPKNPYTGRLDKGLADEFRKRVHDRHVAAKAEIQQMKEQHAKMMEKFRGSAVIKKADQDLRSSTQGTGSEFWRLEGRQDDDEEATGWSSPRQSNKTIEDILSDVEKIVGKHAVVVPDVRRVQDGGYEEPAPEPEPAPPTPPVQPEPAGAGQSASMSRQPSHAGSATSGVMIGDSDVDMGGTAAGLLDQMHTGFSSTSTPINNFPTPQPHLSAIPSAVATPANHNIPSPQPSQQLPATQPPAAAANDDVNMEDVDTSKLSSTTAPDQGTGSGDWVVVPEGGVSPSSSNNPAGAGAGVVPTNQPSAAAVGTDAAAPAPAVATSGQQQQNPLSSKPPSAAPTPGDGLVFDADNNDFSSLGDLDTAGDALAGYDPPSVDDAGGLGDLDMEDSAFGDAFHGVEQSGANTPGDGM
ncbi:hypothetical protein B0T17DRAFT_211139 [Bombardia bombarda]|uniref:DUF1750-domain-containing protein n=1 Tax=Bombardia bombarda TaxID=252184 RepID=A0AA39XA40_9PEZI|nr:hypothetical protein B0T17DRAFT_211139 [Bombardia bombarda]